MKIKTQLRGIIVGLSVIAFSGIGSVYLNTMGNDSTVINNAGLVRGGSQRLVKLEIVGKNGDALIAKLDKLVSGLINGDKDLGLPPATDKEFIFKMQQVKSNWRNLKNTINKARQEPKYQSVLVTESETFFDLANEAVGSAENFSQKKIQKLSTIQLAIFALNLIILAIILVIGRNITSNLQKYTTSIAASSTQIASAIEDQELTAVQQAVSVQQISTTIEELGASSQQSAEQAQASTLGASQALVLAEGGTNTKLQSNV